MADQVPSCMREKCHPTFPDTLLEFGYKFEGGKLQDIKSGEGFKFMVREGDQKYNQSHYEALGEVVTQEVYKLLETECGLVSHPVPRNADQSEPQTFVFASEDALTNPDKLLILIHGSGVVRAGQWARRLIINDTLNSGTQIPFIQEAKRSGYGVLVLNTNDNFRDLKEGRTPIRDSDTPRAHALHVWDNYVRRAPAAHVAIVAHSYGGCVTTALFDERKAEFVKRVFAVAMTDSVHFLSNPPAYKELIRVSCNWVCSQKPLDAPILSQPDDIRRVSAGVTVHEQTSWSSFHSVFKFLKLRLEEQQQRTMENLNGNKRIKKEKEGDKSVTENDDGKEKKTGVENIEGMKKKKIA